MKVRTLVVCAVAFLAANLTFAQTTITIAYTFENHSIGRLLDEFAAKNDIVIKRYWQSQADLKVALIEAIESGSAPDAVIIPADHLGLHRWMNYSVINAEDISVSLSENVLATATIDNKLYGAPFMQGNHLMLFYNKRWVSEPAQSFEAIEQQHERFAQLGVRTIAWNFNEMYFFAPFLGAYGGWPVEQGQLNLHSSAMIQALKAYQVLSQYQSVDPNCDYSCAFDAFIKGELAYTINGDWAIREFSEALGDDLGIALLPSLEGNTLLPMNSSHVLAFPDNALESNKKEALLKLMHYLQSPSVQTRMWQELKVFPVETSAFDLATKTGNENLQTALQQLLQSRAMPSEAAMTYAWGAMAKGYERFINNINTAEQASQLMQSLAERELSKD